MIKSQRFLVSTLRTLVRIDKLQNLRKNYFSNFEVLQARYSSQDINPLYATKRCFTTDAGPLKEVSFEEIKELAKNKDTVVIDVREPMELVENGMIPGSNNIPLGEIERSFRNLSKNEFLKKYGFKKPHEDQILIFSCRAGSRSREAQILALQLGYKNVMNYSGGWTDWTEKSKK